MAGRRSRAGVDPLLFAQLHPPEEALQEVLQGTAVWQTRFDHATVPEVRTIPENCRGAPSARRLR